MKTTIEKIIIVPSAFANCCFSLSSLLLLPCLHLVVVFAFPPALLLMLSISITLVFISDCYFWSAPQFSASCY